MPISNGTDEKKAKGATSGITAALKMLRMLFACCIPHVIPPPPKKSSNNGKLAKHKILSPTPSSLDKTAMGKLGGVQAADAEIAEIFNAIESTVREKLVEAKPELAQTISRLTVIEYKVQLVVGMNYFAKIKINEGPAYIHARIYTPVAGDPWLTSIVSNKTEQDDIEYF